MLLIGSGISDKPHPFGIGQHAVEVVCKNSILAIWRRQIKTATQGIRHKTIAARSPWIEVVVEARDDDIVEI